MGLYKTITPCKICGGEVKKKGSDIYDDRYGYPGEFPLLECTDCGHVLLAAEFSAEQISDLYSNYYPRSSFNLESYKHYEELQGFNAWLEGYKSSPFRWIPKNVRLLDIGCGFGESLGYHQARGCEAYGVEADENIRRVADKFGYKVYVGLFDPDVYEPDYFDYITMSQVIEHVTNPVQTLEGIAHILKGGGIAILSTPNASGWGARVFGKYWINWHAPYHLQFFTLRSMQLAAKQAGLIVEKTATVTPSAWLHFQWIHMLSYPLQDEPSIFWASGGKWAVKQKIALKVLAVIHRCRINHLAARFFDALGWGDNRLYFLRKP
jgi:2-polyprenyl-3-methyl-5-hydroxy-6-metoxy-1,4-benzoquinol methylase